MGKRKRTVDKQQRVLIPKTMAETGPGIVTTTTATISLSEQVFCPFCIHIDKMERFLISTKKGIDYRRGQCPECKQGMLLATLTREFTPEQFAEWVHNDYGKYFWKKVSWTKFRKRLHDIGWSYRFWRRYMELRGTLTTESYEQWIQRKQEEYQRDYEAGLIDEHG